MTSRIMKCFSQQWEREICAERGSRILHEFARAARCGRRAWVSWGAPTPGVSSWVADMTLGALSPLPDASS